MSYISASLRQQIILQAGNRCEYCGLSQTGQAAKFHIDHVIPVSVDGQTIPENLALACVACSLYKAARQNAIDPKTNQLVPIFNPRSQSWEEHFHWNDVHVLGDTSTGRATVNALKMNRPIILAIREEEKLLHRHPPKD